MKILSISDIHGHIEMFKRILEKEVDVEIVVFSGDVAPYRLPQKTYEYLLEIVDMVKIHNIELFVAVPGNIDMANHYDKVQNPLFINVHNNFKMYKGIVFLGFGGSTITPFNTLFEFRDEDIEKKLIELYNLLTKAIPNNNMLVLVTHVPPFGTKCDKAYNGENIGSKAIRKFIEEIAKPALAFCGHVHESRCVERIGNTTVVNPGPLYRGFYATVEISGNEIRVRHHSLV